MCFLIYLRNVNLKIMFNKKHFTAQMLIYIFTTVNSKYYTGTYQYASNDLKIQVYNNQNYYFMGISINRQIFQY